MALKRVTLVSIAFAAAVAGLGVISYVRPFHTAFLLSHDTQCRLSVADGNFRLVWLRAEFFTDIDNPMPSRYCGAFDDTPTHPFRWERNKIRLQDETHVDTFEIGCTLLPLIFLLLVLFVVRPVLKHKRRVRLILAELWYPVQPAGQHRVAVVPPYGPGRPHLRSDGHGFGLGG